MVSTFGIFLFVIVQRASVPWFLQWAKVDGKYPFSSNSVVVSVAFLEILLGVSLACMSRGLVRGLKETLNPREIKKWFLLGLSQAVGDMLELYANKYLDASTYQVLLQSKLLVTALLMRLVTHRGITQSSLEWLLLIALSLGLTTYSILSNGSGSFSALGTMLAVMKVILSCTNAVFTERILKQSQGTPLVHQIVHMKVFWCLWSVVGMAVLEGPAVYAPARFFQGWGISVLVVMTSYIVKNWSGTFLLKRLDSLLKNIAEAFAMLVLYLLEITPIFGQAKTLQLPTFCVTMMVVLLVWAYLESKKKTTEQTTGKQVSFTELLGKPLAYSVDESGMSVWHKEGRRLGKKYGLLPSHSLAKVPSSCRIVANKNAAQTPLNAGASRGNSCNSLASMGSEPLDLEAVPWPSDAESRPQLPMSQNTFGLLDTVQELLQNALDNQQAGNSQGSWQGSITRALDMCKGLKPYLEAVSSKVSPECQAIADATHTTDWPELYRTGCTQSLYHPGMMTSQVQGQMLGFFTSMLSARRVLEVGTFTGFSTLCMAEATPGKVTAIEYDPFLVEYARKYFDRSPHGHKIEVITGDALEVIKNMGVAVDDTSRFDLIFIDGNKTQYAQYFQLINDRDLLAPGGLICIDETLWKGSVYSHGCGDKQNADSDDGVAEAMNELNRQIASDPRLVSVLLPIRNGLTLVRRLDDQVAGERDHFNSQLMRPFPSPAANLPSGLRPRQRRGVTQEGLAPQQAANKRASLPSRMPGGVQTLDDLMPMRNAAKEAAPGKAAEAPKEAAKPEEDDAPETAALNLERQWSGESELSLPALDGMAERIQTC